MARLPGPFIKKAKTDNVIVYEWKGKLCLRTRSSLTRKRVLKSKAYEKTRKYASNMAKAARIGSAIYKELHLVKKDRSLYQGITGMAASLLYQGVDEKEVNNKLKDKFIGKRINVA